METTYFIIEILASLVALSSTYALVMALLKREPSLLATRGFSVLALIGTGVSFGFGASSLFETLELFPALSMLTLLLALANLLAIVVLHRFKLSDCVAYPTPIIATIKLLAIISLVSLIVHICAKLVALAGM